MLDGQYKSNGAGGPESGRLNALPAEEGLLPAANGSTSISISSRPPALVGVRIPSKNMNARELVVRVYEANPHLQRADLWAATRWATLAWKFRKLAEHLDRLPDGGLLTQDGDPRKALGELRALSGELSRLEAALGVTASARAALGADLARMGTFAAEMQQAREG